MGTQSGGEWEGGLWEALEHGGKQLEHPAARQDCWLTCWWKDWDVDQGAHWNELLTMLAPPPGLHLASTLYHSSLHFSVGLKSAGNISMLWISIHSFGPYHMPQQCWWWYELKLNCVLLAYSTLLPNSTPQQPCFGPTATPSSLTTPPPLWQLAFTHYSPIPAPNEPTWPPLWQYGNGVKIRLWGMTELYIPFDLIVIKRQTDR